MNAQFSKNSIYRRKLLQQKLYGLAMIAISILILCVAASGKTVEDRDATAVLLTDPMGLYLLFTKNIVIY